MLFFDYGKPLIVASYASLVTARERAKQIARRDNSFPVVLAVEVASNDDCVTSVVVPEEASVYESSADVSSNRARLGLEETAGIGAILEGLQETLKTGQDIINFGAGQGTVDIDLTRLANIGDNSKRRAAEKEKEARDAKNKEKMKNLRAKKKGKPKDVPGVKQATPADKAKKAKKAEQPTKPTKAGRPKPNKDKRVVGEVIRTATTDKKVTGKTLDGKPANATIKRGSKFKIVKTSRGHELHRKGAPTMIVNKIP